jgi:peptidoglycan-associated lipoprotein
MKKLVISLVLVNLLAACASQKPKAVEVAPVPAPAVVTPSSEISPVTQPVVESAPAPAPAPEPAALDALSDPKSILAKRSVYYALDSYAVEDADKPIVQAHAKYLSEHTGRKIRLEGNADERGSNEYNLALGQRRADGVKKMLMLGGAKDAQIEASSYGEEKPKATSHDEASWSQNRRTDLNY